MLTMTKTNKGFRGLKKDEIEKQTHLYIQTMTVSLLKKKRMRVIP